MKSQVDALLHVVRGILADVRAAYPALRGMDLDLENLAFQCQTRGLTLFTLDLPNLDTLLVSALESGRLQLSGPFSRRISKRVRVPRLFGGLWLRVFDSDGHLKPDADVNAILFIRLLARIGRKLRVECSPDRTQATVENYHDIERRLRNPTLRWCSDNLDVRRADANRCCSDAVAPTSEDLPLFAQSEEGKGQEAEEDRRLLRKIQRVADLLVGAMDECDPVSLSGELEASGQGIGFRHGLGAVSERLKNWEKSQFPTWPQKLEGVFPWGLCGSTAGSPFEPPSHHETASRLLCVPKTAKSPRLIASEPTSHMWCQQLLLYWFERQFESLFEGDFIDLRSQWKSGEMVLQASLDRKHATVDLSDASDRVTCWTVERIFRRHPTLLTALHAARTRYVRDDISRHRGFLKTKKFASQGTATTFPVMSFTMLCIALGSCISGEVTWSKIRRMRSHVRVYGDDIIIPTHGYARLTRAMELLQLRVNGAKSFVRGHFRESCGVDGWKGYDITPVSPQRVIVDGPESVRAVVDITNNLFSKGLWHASNSFKDLLPRGVAKLLRIVGPTDSGRFGFYSFCGTQEDHLAERWNSRYHRYEVLAWGVSSKLDERNRGGYHTLLDFFASRHSHSRPREASKYVGSRRRKVRLQWEPRLTPARGQGAVFPLLQDRPYIGRKPGEGLRSHQRGTVHIRPSTSAGLFDGRTST